MISSSNVLESKKGESSNHSIVVSRLRPPGEGNYGGGIGKSEEIGSELLNFKILLHITGPCFVPGYILRIMFLYYCALESALSRN